MPTQAPHRCMSCKQLVVGPCPTCGGSWAKARQPASWAQGSTREWREFRSHWLDAHRWCMDCGKRATVVCHKPGTNYDRDRCNPEAIEGQRCQTCDRKVTSAQGNAARQR